MESPVFGNVKFEKEMAIARFNRFRRVLKRRQIFEVLVVFGLISWCSARALAVLKFSGAYFVDFSTFLCNNHVVFLIGNAIIVLLLMFCRENEAGGDFYDYNVKYSHAAPAEVHRQDCALPPELDTEDDAIVPIAQCDEVAAAIEKAARQIERFRRTQSEILKREITVLRRPELRRLETENFRKGESSDAADMDTLSSEDFRRRIDAFIDEHYKRTRRSEKFSATFRENCWNEVRKHETQRNISF